LGARLTQQLRALQIGFVDRFDKMTKHRPASAWLTELQKAKVRCQWHAMAPRPSGGISEASRALANAMQSSSRPSANLVDTYPL
jgi:hypothetical protein